MNANDWDEDGFEHAEGGDAFETWQDEVDANDDNEDYDALDGRDAPWALDESDTVSATAIAWAPLFIGNAKLHVSSLGAVRTDSMPFQLMDYGIQYSGTPMRTVRIEVSPATNRNLFVHELVWTAFNGDIPHGWEVRHKMSALQDMDASCVASNGLDDIDIYPVTVTSLKTI